MLKRAVFKLPVFHSRSPPRLACAPPSWPDPRSPLRCFASLAPFQPSRTMRLPPTKMCEWVSTLAQVASSVTQENESCLLLGMAQRLPLLGFLLPVGERELIGKGLKSPHVQNHLLHSRQFNILFYSHFALLLGHADVVVVHGLRICEREKIKFKWLIIELPARKKKTSYDSSFLCFQHLPASTCQMTPLSSIICVWG